MELTTIVGIIIAVIGVLGGMYFKGVPFSNLANEAAIFIILVGTVGSVLNAFPGKDIKNIGKLFSLIFTNKGDVNDVDLVKQLVEYAQLVKKDGILSLEAQLPNIDDELLKAGIIMLTEAQTPEQIEESLSEEIESMQKRHAAMAGIFTQAGTYAPTLGVLGAVIGLIAALGNMEDSDALGHAISGAFMATVYGIFTGYVLWHPFANKLKRKSAAEAVRKTIVLRGVILLAQETNPNIMNEKLMFYLPTSKREDLYKEG